MISLKVKFPYTKKAFGNLSICIKTFSSKNRQTSVSGDHNMQVTTLAAANNKVGNSKGKKKGVTNFPIKFRTYNQ